MIYNDARLDFFLAHAEADLQTAESLYDCLSALDGRSRIFLDSRNLRLGDDWDTELAAAQRRSLITVFLVSTNTVTAYYQREEIAAAIALAREAPDSYRVVPIYIGPCPPQVPYGLRLKHGLTIGHDCSLRDAAARLLDLRRSLLETDASSRVGGTEEAEAKPIAEFVNSIREKAIWQNVEATFRLFLHEVGKAPLPKELQERRERNIEREYAPISVLYTALRMRLEIQALPIVRKRIAIEVALRTEHRLPFTEAGINEVRRQVRKYISDQMGYFFQGAYNDALEHLQRRTGEIADYKLAELKDLREKCMTEEPESLYMQIDDELQVVLSESLLSGV